MSYQNRFLERVASSGRVRVTVRTICLHDGNVLAQRPADEPSETFAFPGGKLEYGELLADRVMAEYQEELGVTPASARYLFVVENRFLHGTKVYHGLEHYFRVRADIRSLQSQEAHIQFAWLPLAMLQDYDLRPHVVRDALCDGSWRSVRLLTVPFARSAVAREEPCP